MFVESNDRFFSAYGSIKDTPEVRRILKDIEHTEYCNRTSYVSDWSYAAVDKDFLSTGVKTLLNILKYLERCFDLCECGNNVLLELKNITDGKVLLKGAILLVEEEDDGVCDTCVETKYYSRFSDFIQSLLEVDGD